MNKKQISKKKMEPTFFQKYNKWIFSGTIAIAVAIIMLLNNNNSIFGRENNNAIPSQFVGSDAAPSMTAPDFNLVTSAGKHLKLSDYKGKVVIVDFWATWCPPCRRGIPDLISLKEKYGEKGFEVIGISVDQESKDDVSPFIQQMGINYPVAYADGGVTEQYGGINSIPTTFVIDKKGKIAASYQGLTPISIYEDQIKKLL